ncbi:SusC/RagA family TonB-linked outer membrane protein [Pedobacter zeae]|uniref:SusC/RagA family TonB-linked outer membrane protein n=1 Tax=Pedobacter zeae TaxID=1737356 RepID=A0A7W6P5U6_9SPHI|nr:SusC/RagA family TonB-linked outer membrane protein [Pedobacter zeae]MBB4108173.1 TonB-linked SusC/RagA family outer membrane protein [Pedobacter zeae]GGG94549.1 SusC/RagA family TonB-linked outer membrane protein [Pedobacter zeae]
MMKFLRNTLVLSVFFTLLAGVIKGQDAIKIPIKAVVRDISGNPVKGASIHIEGSEVFTIANQAGEFSLSADANSTFTVSAKGYKTSLVIASANLKQITLTKDDRLVNVGFKNAEEDNLPAGVSNVNLAQLFEKNFITYGLDGIEAFAPGFNGNNLWGMNTSLILVDGVPRDVNSVTPNEIEDITFLKSASAVALYGSRGAKGVILISTKRGLPIKQKINVRTNIGLNTPKRYPQYLGSSEYMTLYNEALANDGLAAIYSPETIYNHSGINPYRYPSVDYYSSEYLKSSFARYDGVAEISGGNERARYYTNVGFVSTGSLINFGEAKENNTTERFNIRGNVDMQLTKALKARVDASAVFSSGGGVNTNYWANAATLRPHLFTPLIPINLLEQSDEVSRAMIKNAKIIDGQYILGGTQLDQTNPIAAIYAGGNNKFVQRQFQFTTGIDADLKGILNGLTFSSSMGIDYLNSYNQGYRNGYATYQPNWTTYSGTTLIGSLTRWGEDTKTGVQNIADSYYRQTISFSGQFNYNTTIRDKHHISAILLAAAYRQSQSEIYQPTTNSNLGLQLNYDFNRKYFAELTGAVVRSPKMPPGNRVALSPAGSIGWRLSEEPFLKNASFINDLTLTASGGVLNTDLDFDEYFAYESIYTATGGNWYGWNDGTGTQSTDSRRGSNMDLTFAKRKEISVGIKGTMFNNQFNFGANVFRNNITGIIGQINVLYPSYFTTGFPSSSFVPYSNYNSDQRTGVDFYLNFNKRIGAIDWTLGMSGTYYTTKATKRADFLTYENSYQYRAGKPLDAIWGLKSNGFYMDAGEVAAADGINGPKPAFGSALAPGDIKYIDQNGDKIIDDKDQVYLGRGGWFGAPFTAGINLTAKWKNLTLFVLGTGRFGASAMKSDNYFWVNGSDKYSDVVRDRWTPQTKNTATFPRLTTSNGDNNFRASDFWLYSTDRFDLSKVQISYTVSDKLFKSKVLKELGLYVAGFNLLTIAKEKEILELNLGGAPQTRLYNLGVKAMF